MRSKFIHKSVTNTTPQKKISISTKVMLDEEEKIIKKKEENMVTNEMLTKAENALIDEAPKAVKRIKKDKGLIERTESSKTIITEDNKQVLFG